jgi:hypothetical protein
MMTGTTTTKSKSNQKTQKIHIILNNTIGNAKNISCPITGLDSLIGLQEVEAPKISRQSAQVGGKESVLHTSL